jgi:CrcB protein
MLKLSLLVGLGGFIGSVSRFLASNYMTKNFPSLYPFGTFAVNVIGCFIIGIIYSLTEERAILSNESRLLLATGFCGGFTTFSAFSAENLALIKDDQYGLVFIYISLSVVAGILFTYLGTVVGKNF